MKHLMVYRGCCNNADPHMHDLGPVHAAPRYEPRLRKLGRWPFRTNSWQVWDNRREEWAPNALCGGALNVAMAACEGLNGHDTP